MQIPDRSYLSFPSLLLPFSLQSTRAQGQNGLPGSAAEGGAEDVSALLQME